MKPTRLRGAGEVHDVVAKRQPAVVQESMQRDALIASVTDRCRKRGLIENTLGRAVAPVEELVGERYLGSLGIGSERLEEVATAMRPSPNFDHVAVFVEEVVDSVRIGDEISWVATEQLIDCGAVARNGAQTLRHRLSTSEAQKLTQPT
jgi:hypothetical protein